MLLKYYFILLLCSFCVCHILRCTQTLTISNEENLEYICLTICYLDNTIIGNSTCVAVRTSLLISYLLPTKIFETKNLPNISTIAQKTAFARVFINYYFRGIILKAILAYSDIFVNNINSTVECWFDGLQNGGILTINVNKEKFYLDTKKHKHEFVSNIHNNISSILNHNVEFDYFFLSDICPQLTDEIYKNKVLTGSYFSIMRKVRIEKKAFIKTWKTAWLNWFKYRELKEISLNYGSNDIIFIHDYEFFSEKSKNMNVAGIFFLVGGAFMLLSMFCCLSIMRRREVAKDLGYK